MTRPLYPRERDSEPIFTGGYVGPRASFDGCEKFYTRRDSMPKPPTPQRVAKPTELSRPAHFCM